MSTAFTPSEPHDVDHPHPLPSSAATQAAPDAARWVPARPALGDLLAAVPDCHGCSLHAGATHAVMGEGPVPARVMVVAEQPQRLEDRHGRAFVGPGSMLLRRALADAGLEPDAVFLTNALKHSRRWPERRPRRPDEPVGDQLRRCLPWLHAELRLVHPRVVVSLGTSPVEALLGRGVRIHRDRGEVFELPTSYGLSPSPMVLVTSRPQSVARSRQQPEQYARLVDDLVVARNHSLY